VVARAASVGAALLAFFFLPCLAQAHTKSETYTVWHIAGASVRSTFSIPLIEADRLATSGGRASNDDVSSYLASHVWVTSKAGKCANSGPVRAVAATEQFRRFDLAFTCASSEGIELHSSAFFELVPSHVTLAQIELDSGDMIEQMITTDHRTLVLSSGAANELRNASFIDYMKMGVMHIFTGVDHMSFLLGLVLISRRARDLAFVITGFTLGHSATLALAVTGILRPHAEYIDALVALTIALIGAENIAVATRRPEVISIGIASVLIVMAIAWIYVRFGKLPQTQAILYGIKPAIIAVIAQALWRLGRTALKTRTLAVICVVSAVAVFAGANELLVLFVAGVATMGLNNVLRTLLPVPILAAAVSTVSQKAWTDTLGAGAMCASSPSPAGFSIRAVSATC